MKTFDYQRANSVDDAIKIVTMYNPQGFAIAQSVYRVFHNLDTAESMPNKTTRKFIVIAWDEYHAAAFARTSQ